MSIPYCIYLMWTTVINVNPITAKGRDVSNVNAELNIFCPQKLKTRFVGVLHLERLRIIGFYFSVLEVKKKERKKAQ